MENYCVIILDKTIDHIVSWLRTQVKNAKVNGLVVGLSGGLDSAVVSYLIQRAFPDDSLAVIMPLRSNPNDIKHAEAVVQGSGIRSLTIDLSNSHQTLYASIQDQLIEKNELVAETDRLADANLRARLRMSTLYTIATNYNYLVVGTDNASEYFTGYFTKYGDGGVDIQPIIDFTKAEVRDMATVLGVTDEVVQKKPSADLWIGQTDEDEMGTTYDKIDAYIQGEEIPEKDKVIIEKMHKKSMHKRVPLPKYHRKKLF